MLWELVSIALWLILHLYLCIDHLQKPLCFKLSKQCSFNVIPFLHNHISCIIPGGETKADIPQVLPNAKAPNGPAGFCKQPNHIHVSPTSLWRVLLFPLALLPTQYSESHSGSYPTNAPCKPHSETTYTPSVKMNLRCFKMVQVAIQICFLPQGLLARGDLRGGYVEKDEHPIPVIRLDNQASTTAAVHHGYAHPHKGSELVNPHPMSIRGNAAVMGKPETRMSRSYSSEHVSQFHSSENSHSSDPSSQQPHSMVPITATPSPNSTYATSIPSTMSSLGYGSSEDPNSMGPPSLMRSSAPNLHYYSPKSKGSLGTLNSGDEFSNGGNGSGYSSGGMRPRMQKSLSQESADGVMRVQQQPRPTSLILPSNTGGRIAHPQQQQQQQQYFSCPNCKRTFSCAGGDTFEPWFEHIKTCGVQN